MSYLIPLFLFMTILYSWVRNMNPYQSFLNGAKGGLSIFSHLLPNLMGMILATSLLKASGIIEDLSTLLVSTYSFDQDILNFIPLILLKPLSGSAGLSIVTELCMSSALSFSCFGGSIIQGALEPIFYLLTLYGSQKKNYYQLILITLVSGTVSLIITLSLAYAFIN